MVYYSGRLMEVESGSVLQLYKCNGGCGMANWHGWLGGRIVWIPLSN